MSTLDAAARTTLAGSPQPEGSTASVVRRTSAKDTCHEQSRTSVASDSIAFLFLLIGRNRRGNWVAQDQQGLHGGLFVSRAHALKYALFENGNKPHAVVMVPGVLELDMGRGRPALPIADNAPVPERRAA